MIESTTLMILLYDQGITPWFYVDQDVLETLNPISTYRYQSRKREKGGNRGKAEVGLHIE